MLPHPVLRKLRWVWGVSVVLGGWLLALGVLVAPPAAAQTAHDYYTSARFDFLDGNYTRALANLDRALALSPLDPRFVILRLNLLERLGRRDEAIAYAKDRLARAPKRLGFLRFELAFLYLRNHQNHQALAQLQAAARLDPARARREMALLLMRAGRYRQALAALGRLSPQDPRRYYLAAQVHLRAKEYDAALEACRRGLALKPKPALARDLRSLLHLCQTTRWADRALKGYLTLQFSYNDNVYTDPLADNPAIVPPRKRDDFLLLARLALDWRLWRRREHSLGLTGSVVKSTQFELGDADYAGWALGGYWTWSGREWGLRLPVEYAYYYAQSSLSRKLQALRLSPSLYWQPTPRFRTEFDGILQRRLYFRGESNVTRYGLGVTHFWLLKGWQRHLRLGYRLDRDRADDGQTGYLVYEITLGFGTHLWGPLSLDTAVTYAHYRFDERPDPYLVAEKGVAGARMVRQDNQFRFQFQLVYRPSPRWSLALAYYFTDNDSNVATASDTDPYRFRQNVVALIYTWVF